MANLANFSKSIKTSNIATKVMTTFDMFKGMLYPHQLSAFDECMVAVKGQVSMPTGSGKTKTQIALILEDMYKKNKIGESGVYGIASHRLMLNTQLIRELSETTLKMGFDFKVLFVGSGNVDADDLQPTEQDLDMDSTNVRSTLKTEAVSEMVDDCKSCNSHLLIVSTYHSIDKLKNIHIDLLCCDEAHTLVGSNIDDKTFLQNLKAITHNVDRVYYFTATRKGQKGSKLGMDDTDFFGDILKEIAPKEMVDGGYITPIKTHIIKQAGDELVEKVEKSNKMKASFIKEAFIAHEQLVTKSAELAALNGVGDGKFGTKLLVNADGSKTIKDLKINKEFLSWTKENNIKVFMVGSHKEIGATINGVDVTRSEFYSELKGLTDEDKAIIIHIQILTEGIDLPGITGVLFMGEKSLIPLLQSAGRALRRTHIDRKNIVVDKSVSVPEVEKQVKPYGYVILPEGFFINDSSLNEMKTIISFIMTEYEVKVDNIALITDEKGIPVDPDGDTTGKKKDEKLSGIIAELKHEVESADRMIRCDEYLKELDEKIKALLGNQ